MTKAELAGRRAACYLLPAEPFGDRVGDVVGFHVALAAGQRSGCSVMYAWGLEMALV